MTTKRSLWRRRRSLPGAPPGTVAVDDKARMSSIHAIAFDKDGVDERDDTTMSELPGLRSGRATVWVNVDGLGDASVIHDLTDTFALHGLAMEDVVNVGQRPKVEDYDNCLFAILPMASPERPAHPEQVSLFLGSGFVLTFQERPGDCLDPVRKRLRHGRPRIRSSGADYLAYAIIDAVIDGYFPILETYGDRLLELEERLLTDDRRLTVVQLYDLKRDLLALRGVIRPLRESVGSLLRLDTPLVSNTTRLYLRDCYDHALYLTELAEHHHELSSSLIELYRSNIQGRLNEVMKVLTIIATVFIPMTFIAGVYGMNFDPQASPWNMPELAWYWGYPFAMTLMAVVGLSMLVFFRRKGWLGGSSDAPEDSA